MRALHPGPAPPGPRGRRWVGNLQDYEQDRLGFLVAVRDTYGDLVAFDRRTTIVNSGRLARTLLQDRGRLVTVRENFLQERLSAEALDEMVRVRRLLNPGLRPSALASVAPAVAAIVDDVFAVPDGHVGDPVPMMEAVMSRVITSFYFGADGESLPRPLGRLLDALAAVIGNPFALPPNRWTPARRRIDRCHREVLDLILPLLHCRDADPSAYSDFAAELVAARTSETSVDRLAHLVVGSLLAAHRVPAAAAGWLLMLVADHPETLPGVESEAARFRRAMAEAPSGRSYQYPFTMALVLETLRLYPPTWLISRRAVGAVRLGGYVFAEGHNFMVSPYVVHRDDREFPDAEAFRPQRWLEESRPTGTFLAFGHGRHACPGSNLAVWTLVAALLALASRRRWTRVPGVVRPDPRTTLLPRDLRLCLTHRDGVGSRLSA